MRRLFLLSRLIIIVSLVVACNRDDDPVLNEPQMVAVAFNAVVEGVNESSIKGGLTSRADEDYDRGNAPVEITGVTITADNQTFGDFPDVVENFPFDNLAPTSGEFDTAITMVVGAGINNFSAVSTTDITDGIFLNLDFTNKLDSSNPDFDTLEERATEYASALRILDPIYIEYSDSATEEISFVTGVFDSGTRIIDNEVDLSMSADLGRTSIVFETEANLIFRVTATLRDVGDAVIETREIIHSDVNTASAIVFNDTNMVNTTHITVQIARSSNGTEFDLVTDAISVSTEQGISITHLVNFNGSNTVEAGINLTFDPITEQNGGEDTE